MAEIKTKNIFSIAIALLLLIEGIFTTFNPIKVSAAEDYRLWRQWDERWGDIYLGESSDTMARSGCLVTAVAILAVHSGTKDADTFNPGTFVENLNEVGAFDSWGAIASWAKVTEVIPEIRFVKSANFTSTTQEGKAEEILATIEEGYYVICNVGGHWVFVEGVDGSDVYMIDSAMDEVKMFEGYENEYISSWQAYTGKNPPTNIIGPLTTTTTTTTTTSSSTVTTTTTTTPPITTTTAPTFYDIGEYYCSDNGLVSVYSSSTDSNEIVYLKKGYIINITSTSNGRGSFIIGDTVGWVDMKQISYLGEADSHKKGDINNDGEINISDLALLSEYLNSLEELPYGISILRSHEIEAADINSDSRIDNLDVQKYLAIVCS